MYTLTTEDVQIVVEQALCTTEKAQEALLKYQGDLCNAILSLIDIDRPSLPNSVVDFDGMETEVEKSKLPNGWIQVPIKYWQPGRLNTKDPQPTGNLVNPCVEAAESRIGGLKDLTGNDHCRLRDIPEYQREHLKYLANQMYGHFHLPLLESTGEVHPRHPEPPLGPNKHYKVGH